MRPVPGGGARCWLAELAQAMADTQHSNGTGWEMAWCGLMDAAALKRDGQSESANPVAVGDVRIWIELYHRPL